MLFDAVFVLVGALLVLTGVVWWDRLTRRPFLTIYLMMAMIAGLAMLVFGLVEIVLRLMQPMLPLVV